MKYPLSILALSFVLLGAGCASPPSERTGVSDSVLDVRFDLSGRELTQVPSYVFQKKGLVALDLSHNRLSGAIPGEIRFLSALETLDLSDNAMTGLPAEIGQLRRLKTLDLSNNRLTGLPLELGQLSALETLDLRGNSVSAYDLGLIRKELPQETNVLVD